MNIYFISGLGADRHAFDRIQLPKTYTPFFIDWLDPYPNETLQAYAVRMAADINRNEAFVLVGLSFGGIISIEIDKFLPAAKIIIISSISHSKQIPWYFKIAGRLHLHRWGLVSLIKRLPPLTNWLFGAGNGKIKTYLQTMIQRTTRNYLVWSLNAIVHWKQSEKPQKVVHIHGTKDKLFPIRFIEADYALAHGNHFMVITHAHKIAEIIDKELQPLLTPP